MRGWMPLWLAIVACGEARKPASIPPAAPAPAPLRAVPAQPMVKPAQASRALAAIDVTNLDQPFGEHHAIRIDDAGIATTPGHDVFEPRGAGEIALPFTQPVVEVVFVDHVARKGAGGVARGRVYCARTRSAQLECATDYTTTKLDGSKTRDAAYVFAAVTDGNVTHVATSRGATTLVCARIERSAGVSGACWTSSPDGMTLVPATAADAIGIATKIPSAVAAAWQRADPDATVARMTKTVVSNADDSARILPAGASTAVWCALLESGVLTCYGPGVYGELGDGVLDGRLRASRPLGTTRVVDVTLRNHTVCAVTEAGRVACWGDVLGGIPLPAATKRTALPACKLDRATSRARYDHAKQEIDRRAKDCVRSCDANPVRDCHLNCERPCNREPYVFDHRTLCQEPGEHDLRSLIPHFLPEPCANFDRTPQWLSDAEIARIADKTDLVLAPAYVTGVRDAVRAALSGPFLCVLRRGGVVACTGKR